MKPDQFICLMYGGVTKMGLSSDLILFTCNNTRNKRRVGWNADNCRKASWARFGHTACLLRDDDSKQMTTRLAVVGGSSKRGMRGQDTEPVWILDLVTMAWSSPMYRRTINLGFRQMNMTFVLSSLVAELEELARSFRLELSNKQKSRQRRSKVVKRSAKDLQKLMKVLNVAFLDQGGYISSTLRAYAPLAQLASQAGHEVCMTLQSLDPGSLEQVMKSGQSGGGTSIFDAKLEESELAPPLRPKSRFRGSAVPHPDGGILIFGGRAEDSAEAWWIWRLMWSPIAADPEDIEATASWRNRDRSGSFSSVYSTDDDSGSGSGRGAKSTGGSGSSDGGFCNRLRSPGRTACNILC